MTDEELGVTFLLLDGVLLLLHPCLLISLQLFFTFAFSQRYFLFSSFHFNASNIRMPLAFMYFDEGYFNNMEKISWVKFQKFILLTFLTSWKDSINLTCFLFFFFTFLEGTSKIRVKNPWNLCPSCPWLKFSIYYSKFSLSCFTQ